MASISSLASSASLSASAVNQLMVDVSFSTTVAGKTITRCNILRRPVRRRRFHHLRSRGQRLISPGRETTSVPASIRSCSDAYPKWPAPEELIPGPSVIRQKTCKPILSCAVIPLGAALPRTLISDLPEVSAMARAA